MLPSHAITATGRRSRGTMRPTSQTSNAASRTSAASASGASHTRSLPKSHSPPKTVRRMSCTKASTTPPIRPSQSAIWRIATPPQDEAGSARAEAGSALIALRQEDGVRRSPDAPRALRSDQAARRLVSVAPLGLETRALHQVLPNVAHVADTLAADEIG